MILITPKLEEKFIEEIAYHTKMNVYNSPIASLTRLEKEKVEIIISYGNYGDDIFASDIQSLPNLKWINLLSSGTNHLPMEQIKTRNIKLTTSRGIHGIPISEYVFATLLYFIKRIEIFNQLKATKTWEMHKTEELYGKTIGILGTGAIGSEIGKRAKAFGMLPIGVNRSGQIIENFDEVYPISELEEQINRFDIIVSALPSTKETTHLVNKQLINKMKDNLIFINVGRGDLVVEADLLEAIIDEKFFCVVMDVFYEEPLPKDSKLWDCENVIITPHISSSTSKYIPRALSLFYQKFDLFTKGQLYTSNELT